MSKRKTQPFDADTLEIALRNEQPENDQFLHHVKMLRSIVNRTANRVAKANADWHDDPESEDHADFHAPAADQFPQAVRDEALKSILNFFLTEFELGNYRDL